MSRHPNELRCEQQNMMNALKEFQKNNKPTDYCNRPKHVPAAGLGSYSQCCRPSAISPVVVAREPPPAPPVPKVVTDDDYCAETIRQPSIPKYVKIQECTCVKFNGLQDSCQHSACRPRVGCFDVPFPTCPPACEWKRQYGNISYDNKNANGC